MKNPVRKEKKEKTSEKKRKKSGFARIINSILNGEFLTREGFVKHVPFLAYLSFLFVVFIAIGYFYENTLRDLSKYERKLENTKHEYHTTLYKLEQIRLQSRLITDMKDLGLEKTVEQPKVIEVEQGYFDEGQ